MGATERVLFWLCIAIGALVGGGMLLIPDPQVQTWGVYVLVGMVAAALVLRWVFRVFR
jgi:hypothetical protein